MSVWRKEVPGHDAGEEMMTLRCDAACAAGDAAEAACEALRAMNETSLRRKPLHSCAAASQGAQAPSRAT